MFEHIVDRPKLVDKLCSGLLAHTRTTRKVVGRVAHKCQKVDYLGWGRDTVSVFYFVHTYHIVASAMPWTIHVDVLSDKLTVVLVGRKHKGGNALAACQRCHRTDNVVRLEAIDLQDRYAHGFENLLYVGNRQLYVFWCFLSLCLILGECLVSEGETMVESHGNVCGIFLCQHFVQRVAETHNSRCIHSF